jgi:hypothetical protein
LCVQRGVRLWQEEQGENGTRERDPGGHDKSDVHALYERSADGYEEQGEMELSCGRNATKHALADSADDGAGQLCQADVSEIPGADDAAEDRDAQWSADLVNGLHNGAANPAAIW